MGQDKAHDDYIDSNMGTGLKPMTVVQILQWEQDKTHDDYIKPMMVVQIPQ